MTDLLLINPSYVDYGTSRVSKWDFYSLLDVSPPIGLLYVASSVIAAGYKVQFIDLEAEKLSFKKLIEIIKKIKPKLIGISCPSPIFNTFSELAGAIKKAANIPIIAGGPHTLADPESMMELKTIDYCIQGEADFNVVELVDFLLKGKGGIDEIGGLSHRRNGKVVHNKPSKVIFDLDKVPLPARHLLKKGLYFNAFNKKRFYSCLITTRGCPFKCLFCFPMSRNLRRRSIDNVILEIKECIQKYKIRSLDISDDTFNFDKEWVVDFCNALIREGLKISWRAKCRPDLIDKEVLQSMERAGCEVISMGAESANDHTLKWLKKEYCLEEISKAVELISQTNISLHGYFILGSPFESRKDMLNTINFACENKFDFSTFSILTPYPGTELFKISLSSGYLEGWSKKDYSKTIGICKPMLKHPTMTNNDMQELIQYAYKKFYIRPKQLFLLFKNAISNPVGSYKIGKRMISNFR